MEQIGSGIGRVAEKELENIEPANIAMNKFLKSAIEAAGKALAEKMEAEQDPDERLRFITEAIPMIEELSKAVRRVKK